jgi:hypothetical protein
LIFYFNHHKFTIDQTGNKICPSIRSTPKIHHLSPSLRNFAQVKKIRKLLDDAKIAGVGIGSVENFQGQVRSLGQTIAETASEWFGSGAPSYHYVDGPE